MRKVIEHKENKETTVCDKCGFEVNYEELNNGAYTVGGIGINWEKLLGIKLARPDEDDLDFHLACLVQVVMLKAEPEALMEAKPNLFPKEKREAIEK